MGIRILSDFRQRRRKRQSVDGEKEFYTILSRGFLSFLMGSACFFISFEALRYH